MTLLGLPYEVRAYILSELLDTKRAPVVVIRGRRRHQLYLAILRVNRGLYEEASSILWDNQLVKLLCTGPRGFGPGAGLPTAGSNAAAVKRARIAVAEIDVDVMTPHDGDGHSDCHLITGNTLALYFEHLAARQITTVPTRTFGYREPALDEDVWWLRYDVTVTLLKPPPPIRDGGQELAKHRQEESRIYSCLRGLRHADNTCTINHRLLPEEASRTQRYMRSTESSFNAWLFHVLQITTVRKVRLNELYDTHGEELARTGQELLLSFRDICLDMQFFLESCELAISSDQEEALGTFRGQLLTLLFSCFHSYVQVYYYHDCAHLEIWPFHQECQLMRCVCLALAQTDAIIDYDIPSEDVDISLDLWHYMQHLAIMLHRVWKQDDDDLELSALFLLLTELSNRISTAGGAHSELTVDIQVVERALMNSCSSDLHADNTETTEIWRTLWNQLSLRRCVPCLLGPDGTLAR